MYGCESWTVKKAEHWRIDAFELWCWRRLLRVPWTARRSNQSILKEIGPGCSLERMMLKLKLQYFGHLMWRVDSLEKDSDAGRGWRQEEKGMTEDEMAGWHYRGREFEWTLGVGHGQGGLACCSSWGRKEFNMTEWLNWTELKAVCGPRNSSHFYFLKLLLLLYQLSLPDVLCNLSGSANGKQPICQCWRHKKCGRFTEGGHGNPTPVLPGKSHGHRSLSGCAWFIGLQSVGHDWSNSACT